jgi:hypothetical protein
LLLLGGNFSLSHAAVSNSISVLGTKKLRVETTMYSAAVEAFTPFRGGTGFFAELTLLLPDEFILFVLDCSVVLGVSE